MGAQGKFFPTPAYRLGSLLSAGSGRCFRLPGWCLYVQVCGIQVIPRCPQDYGELREARGCTRCVDFYRRETFSIENKVNSLRYLSSFETTCCPPRSQQPVPERLPTLNSPCLQCYFSCTVSEVTHADTNTQPDIPKVISYDLRHYVHGNILKY